MEFLGIGPLELLFIVLIALLILGPKDMVRIGKSLGQWLNKLVRSEFWKTAREASEKVRSLPTDLMREAGIEEMKKSVDAGVIQPLKEAGKMPPPAAGGVPEPGSGASSPVPGLPADDPNKIAPPPPGPEERK